MRHCLVLGAALLFAAPALAQPTQPGTQSHGPFDTAAGVAGSPGVGGFASVGTGASDAISNARLGQPLGPAQLDASGTAGANTVMASGGFIARTLAAWFGDTINVKAQGAVCDGVTDDSAAFGRALTAVAAATFGGDVVIPAGDCVISAALAVSLGANQRFVFRSGGQHGARLHFTNPAAAGLAVTMAPVLAGTWISNGPSAAVQDVTFISDWSTSTAQAAISVIVSPGVVGPPATYSRPLPPSVSVSRVASISKTNSGGFAKLVSLSGVAVSKLDNISLWASAGDTTATALAISSPNNVATGIRINGLRQQAGGTALVVTDSMQGVYVTDMQTVGTQHSVSWTNPGGYAGADNLIIDHSQLNSVLGEIDTSNVAHVQIANNYILGGVAGWYGAKIVGGIGHTVTGNAFLTTVAGGDTTATAVSMASVIGGGISGNTFYGLTGASLAGAPILLSGTTTAVLATGNQSSTGSIGFDATATPANNKFSGNKVGNLFLPFGTAGANNTVVAGPTGSDSQAASINSGAVNSLIVGTGETISSLCTSSLVVGFAGTCNASLTASFGQSHTVTGARNVVAGTGGAAPYIGCSTLAQDTNGFVGGNQVTTCVWPKQTASASAVRFTADGTATVANYNVFALNSLEAGSPTGTIDAAFDITITMSNYTHPAQGGTWHLHDGWLHNDGTANTTWSGGTPTALGTAFTVALSADTATTGLNLTVTPPSADAITWTTTLTATITRAHP